MAVAMTDRALSVARLLEVKSREAPNAIAVMTPGRPPLTYQALYDHAHEVRDALNAMGIGRGDRVAVVTRNGPEAAVAFTAVAASTTCAPLNPAYRAKEFGFYLTDLKAKALIIEAGLDSPARTVAQELGLTSIELEPRGEAGIFALKGGKRSAATCGGFAEPGDKALLLHTSGTTGRPKLVPLTHANICISARNVVTALKLTREDRCLNVMPLYHIHALIAATLSSLAAGASLVYPPGLDAAKFPEWLEEFWPSWYTASPAIHQAILSHAAGNGAVIHRCRLRFIRSSSAALPPRVSRELEQVFSTPVLEAYGMTEAAYQICSNPLPPRPRKEGSVGVPMGPEVAIMDTSGHLLPPGAAGEIVIRGPSVTSGYEGGPEVNKEAFAGAWLRTGDQGIVDGDGYFFIKGRLKELINRGGEKITPREIDEVLLDHPAVAQAVTFALPHPTLGEDVAAAVVLRQHTAATEAAIRRFAATRLADFKLPHRVLIVDEIPKGPTGKYNRALMAQQFAPVLKATFVPPRTPLESALAEIWAAILGVDQVGVRDDFFELGGDSLSAAIMLAQVERKIGKNLPVTVLFQATTVEQLAAVAREDREQPWPLLVPLQSGGSRPPFFMMPHVVGNVLGYRLLARYLGPDQPVYGLQAQGLDGVLPPLTRVEDMAARYVEEIRRLLPDGPYLLGGHSFGGMVAFEVARQIVAQGGPVAFLGLFDANLVPPDYTESRGSAAWFLLRRIDFHLDNLKQLGLLSYARHAIRTLRERADRRMHRGVEPSSPPEAMPEEAELQLLPPVHRRILGINREAEKNYRPRTYPGQATVFFASQRAFMHPDPRIPWGLAGGVKIHKAPGDHLTMVREPHVRILARKLRVCLNNAMNSLRRQDLASVSPGKYSAASSQD